MRAVRQHALDQKDVVDPLQWASLWQETVAFIDAALLRLVPYADQFPQDSADLLDLGLRGSRTW